MQLAASVPKAMKYIQSHNKKETVQLGPEPCIADNASIIESYLGRYTEVQEHCKLHDVHLDDYSYVTEGCSLAHCRIGKFSNIASRARINPGNHPMDWVSQHHFQYRKKMYGFAENDDASFFSWRASQQVHIGHDVWLGHHVTVLAGVSVGNGAVIGAGAVVSKDIAPYAIAVGVPARVIRYRFEPAIIDKLQAIAWWNWDHETLKQRLVEFRDIRNFLDRYGDTT